MATMTGDAGADLGGTTLNERFIVAGRLGAWDAAVWLATRWKFPPCAGSRG